MRTGAPTVVILTLIFLAGHALGSFFSLYEDIAWFDMVMHALGGAWLAAIFIVLGPLRYPSYFAVTSLNRANFSSRTRVMLRVVFLVLLAGGLWELYEYGFAVWATTRFGNLGFFQPTLDTLSDLLLDAAGAVPIALFFFREEREVA